MKKKINQDEYLNILEFRSDFELMCDNAMKYNRPDTIYWQAAKKLLTTGNKLMNKDKLLNFRRTIECFSRLTEREFGFRIDTINHTNDEQLINLNEQIKYGTEIKFTCTKPLKVLVGFFKPQKAAFSKDTTFLKEPELETNASANDYGQAEIKIANAVVIRGMPPVNVHSYSFAAGDNVLKLAKGVCLILGFVDGDQVIPVYDAGLTEEGIKKEIDWLFE